VNLSPLQQLAIANTGLTIEQLQAEMPLSEETGSRRIVEVPNGTELRRIQALPTRQPPASNPEAAQLADFLTTKLAKTAKPYPGKLNVIQSVFLQEAWMRKGAVGPIRAGGGKTLLAYLLPTILGAKRPVYMTPPSLEQGVRREFRKFAKDWHGPHPDAYTFLSYKVMGRSGAGPQLDGEGRVLRAPLLDRLDPDLIVADEAHFLKNKTASVTRKVKRFLETHPTCIFVPMSGTFMRRSVKDFAHIFEWALKEGSPVPRAYAELEAWADHLDEKAAMGPRAERGALSVFFTKQEDDRFNTLSDEEEKRNVSREVVGRRIVETPGVVSTQDGPLGIPLYIDAVFPTHEDPKISEFFAGVRAQWMLPDGQIIVDGKDLARHAKCMGLGYWLRWIEKPPESWLMARSTWGAFARRVIQYNRRGIDSEKAVIDNIQTGLIQDHGLYAGWIQERDDLRKKTGHLQPPTEEVVFSTECVDYAVKWAEENKGIVWVLNLKFGARLAAAIGTSFYAEKGLDEKGRFVEDHPENSPIVLSWGSNREGKNLQKKWNRGLWLGATPEEQSLARSHRPGSEFEDVRNTLYLGAHEHCAAYWTQVAIARGVERTQKQAQRLCYAESSVPELDEIEKRHCPRYVK
jgi:hypothetical protein